MEKVIEALETYAKEERAKGRGEIGISFPVNKIASVFQCGARIGISVDVLVEELKAQQRQKA